MMLVAKVKRSKDVASHSLGGILEGTIETAPIQAPASLELVQRDGAYYLLHLDDAGQCIADTWHPSIEEAKAQAEFEFGIGPEDWAIASEA